MLAEAAPLIDEDYVKTPPAPDRRRDKALLLALQGNHKEARAAIPGILEKVPRDKGYHHCAYDIARASGL